MRTRINGTTLNVLQGSAINKPQLANANPALVFLHYFGGSSREWSEVVARLADDYLCVALDLRGFGESDAASAEITVSDYADDVASLTDALQLNRYILVGHSMGGKIALALAARRPPGLESLILVAPSPPTPEPVKEDECEHLLEAYGNRVAIEEMIKRLTAQPLAPATFEEAVEDHLRASRAAWRTWIEHGSREDISAHIPNIAVPVFIIAGASDQNFPSPLLEREIVRRLPATRLVKVKNAGHLLPLEVPDDVARLIRKDAESFAIAGAGKGNVRMDASAT